MRMSACHFFLLSLRNLETSASLCVTSPLLENSQSASWRLRIWKRWMPVAYLVKCYTYSYKSCVKISHSSRRLLIGNHEDCTNMYIFISVLLRNHSILGLTYSVWNLIESFSLVFTAAALQWSKLKERCLHKSMTALNINLKKWF